MIKDENIYIAGPACFYERGNELWDSWKKEAIYYGFGVSLPNDAKLDFDPDDKKSLSAAIFKNCYDSIKASTGIIANFETYRGAEPDGGTIYEVGMAYGRGLKCYGYTRDKRPIGVKYQSGRYVGDTLLDLDGRQLPDLKLPFSACLVGACKIVEGSFSDALKVYMLDIEEESKRKAMHLKAEIAIPDQTIPRSGRPIVYLATLERYSDQAAEKYAAMKEVLDRYGFDAIAPSDLAPGVEDLATDDVYARAYNLFDRYQQHVRNCDIILADLSDYHGYEPNSDVAFECGMANSLGKKMFAYMDDVRPMIERIPNSGEPGGFRDINGMNVENFEAPLNLMFGASMELFGGAFEDVVRQMAASLKK
ncbi:nucleoside 2-deoxyribosyltransferase [Neobittarella massiliensis]|uniref:Nucleoside 2-deoxyribosyltransferase n=2 Tax=Oscillospiraceae TaxID=216572 RepID=A0A8J6ILF7_9FIRM|nr:nucleoside 2-deoxyribosyltransferase [Neobittarella massiliensis]MBC3514947.1 nucleoside 2-deoxyribosyltransferase [Neobittarella massiliensis]SCJ68750.1 Nucleoside 2-deoxyribosyltransferase [uncultured Anaerotruncus sp.]